MVKGKKKKKKKKKKTQMNENRRLDFIKFYHFIIIYKVLAVIPSSMIMHCSCWLED